MRYHESLLTSERLDRAPDVLWMRQVAHANRATTIQGYYKVYKGEQKVPNEANKSRRETAAARRQRLEGILAQHK